MSNDVTPPRADGGYAVDPAAAPAGIDAQDELISQLEADEFGWDLMIGAAFVRGMRDIGYKSTAFALAELIDNSIQAHATKVDVVFGFDGGARPTKLAVVDDGHGMKPKMVRASLIWGAGTRHANRDGFGKYGYGLPSASVSQCYRVEVYSKVEGGPWYMAYLDVDEIKDGKWTKGSRIETPVQQLVEPPAFVVEHLMDTGRWNNFDHGTVVVWDRLDPERTDAKRREDLRNKLSTSLGVVYRNYLIKTRMTVDGVDVEPCDPLFLTPGFRYFDLDDDRARAYPEAVVPIKDKATDEEIGVMRLRFSLMPPSFFRKPEFKHTNRPGRKKEVMNGRLEIADANNGIIFLRNGRQIDVVRPPRKLGSINATTDRFWAVEVDFDATLDELFSITTAKQQVTPHERVWDILSAQANLFKVIAEMRGTYNREAKKIAAEAEQAKDEKRASVQAIEEADKFRTTKTPSDTPERREEAKKNLDHSARDKAKRSGLKPEVVERELVAEREGVTHQVETEELPGAPFYRCVQEGGTRVLYLNVAHPFYTELYMGPGSSPRLRAGLEVLLWTLGNAEVDADPDSDVRKFYVRQRTNVWTPALADALDVLKGIALVESNPEQDQEAA